jgi:hypothetical protein
MTASGSRPATADGSGTAVAARIATGWWEMLRAGDHDAVLGELGPDAVLDDPHAGPVTGRVAVDARLGDTARWCAAARVGVEPVAATAADGRAVAEAVLGDSRLRRAAAALARRSSPGDGR